MTPADGVTQLLSANVQLDSALTQLGQGLRTLESSRASALEQVDLSGALNIQTITALLTAQNFSMPAGYLQEDGVNYMVSVGDSISSRQELSDMVLFDLGLEGVEPTPRRRCPTTFRPAATRWRKSTTACTSCR